MLLSALTSLLACSSSPHYWEDVRPILQARCVNCHQEGGVGPMPLGDYQEAAAWAELIEVSVSSGRMPPWPAAAGPAYDYDWRLSEEQILTLTEWAQAGAPEGDPEAEGEALESVGSQLSRSDLTLTMPEPYTPSSEESDDYRCFVLDWTETETRFITGFNALPGNGALVHHVAAFLISSDNLLGDAVFEQLADWEEESEGAGYPCFGGPSGPTGDLELPIQQIAQWVPGNQGLDFPAGTGIEVLPGSQVVLQIHYNLAQGQGESDQSALEFRLDDQVESRAVYAPWLDILWPLGEMNIDPQEVEDFTAEGDPRSFFELLNPSLDLSAGFRIHSSMIHMHQIGDSAELSLLKASGEVQPIVSIPQWDFDWQLSYQLSEPLLFEEGDELSLTCVFDNPSDAEVSWGEGSDDEMCVGNLYISLLE